MAGNLGRRERARERDGERVREREREEGATFAISDWIVYACDWISWVRRETERERERVTECERPPAHHHCRLPFDQLSLSPLEGDKKREREMEKESGDFGRQEPEDFHALAPLLFFFF